MTKTEDLKFWATNPRTGRLQLVDMRRGIQLENRGWKVELDLSAEQRSERADWEAAGIGTN